MIGECLVVEFRVSGDQCPLADASLGAGVTIEAAPPLRRSDGNTLLRFTAPVESVGGHLDADDRIRYLHRAETDGRHTFRCLSKHPCIVHDLIDVGFLVETIHYREGSEQYVGAVVGQEVLDGVLAAAGETVGMTLERISPLGETGESAVEARWNVTPKQAAALRVAYDMGYFDVPKGASAEEIAEALDISKTAVLERIRRGQSALLGQILS